jgi:hypothetical protein
VCLVGLDTVERLAVLADGCWFDTLGLDLIHCRRCVVEVDWNCEYERPSQEMKSASSSIWSETVLEIKKVLRSQGPFIYTCGIQ